MTAFEELKQVAMRLMIEKHDLIMLINKFPDMPAGKVLNMYYEELERKEDELLKTST
jgi:hypothetical protein